MRFNGYVEGTPLSKVDPTGEITFVPFLIGIGVGMAFDYPVSEWRKSIVHVSTLRLSPALRAMEPLVLQTVFLVPMQANPVQEYQVVAQKAAEHQFLAKRTTPQLRGVPTPWPLETLFEMLAGRCRARFHTFPLPWLLTKYTMYSTAIENQK